MKVTDDVYWRLQGHRDAGMSLEASAEFMDLAVRTITSNLALGPPSDRKRKASKKAPPALIKRRALVKKLLTRRVKLHEKFEPTLNGDGSVRKNSRLARVQTRHPTGSLARCRRALWNEHKIAVSRSTVRRDMLANGLQCKRRPKGPERFAGDEEKRLAYVKKNLPFAQENARSVVFVDEKLFDSLDSDIFAYVKPGERAPPREVERFTPRVHVFGMIGVGFKFLHIFDDNESITSDVYKTKCIEPNLRRLRSRWLVQDGAGAHKGVMDWLRKQKIRGLLHHPARSPDLNPIERMWSLVQQRVAAYGPLTKEQLCEYVRQCWDEIPQATVDKLVLSWPDMMEAVLAMKGETSCKNLKKPRRR